MPSVKKEIRNKIEKNKINLMIEKNWKRENICERKMHKEKKILLIMILWYLLNFCKKMFSYIIVFVSS